jgi:hypothetical protein
VSEFLDERVKKLGQSSNSVMNPELFPPERDGLCIGLRGGDGNLLA